MRHKIYKLFFGSLRRQLIIGVASVNAIGIALFIGDLTQRQRALFLERQTELATAIAQTLAISSADWLAAHDVTGLQELTEAQLRNPELKFALIANTQGQVLAHTDRSHLGQYIIDLPLRVEQATLNRTEVLVDVLVPAKLANQHVGWVRVGVDQGLAIEKLSKITQDAILYALLVIIIASILAWLAAWKLTRRLYVIRSVMDEVQTGKTSARSQITGDDEAAHLSTGFNTMLDRLEKREDEIMLSNRALAEAKDVAEKSLRVKSRFLDMAAHELRTPVTTFSLLLQFTKKQLEEGQPVSISTLDRLSKQSDRLANLVVDLLDVSRLERGVVVLQLARTDIISLINTCVEDFRTLSPKRHFIFNPPNQPIEIDIDALRIHQVLSNLLDNAIKYTPEGSPIEVTIDAHLDRIHVSVKDQGAGISLRDQAELFKPFTRGGNDRAERQSGLGLGLYICHKTIELHGGTIGVTSLPGTGSTFYFDLPRKKPHP